jgi:hypothetical protein
MGTDEHECFLTANLAAKRCAVLFRLFKKRRENPAAHMKSAGFADLRRLARALHYATKIKFAC